MGLDFTAIKDERGAAIYFIHDGSVQGESRFQRLMDDVSRRSKKQSLLLSVREGDGQKIVDFYKLRGTNFVLIVRDDDQLHHVWSDGENFDASHIAYTAEQAG